MRKKAFTWRRTALFLGYVILLAAALRRPTQAPQPSDEPRNAHQPPAPPRRGHERGSIIARSVGLLFVATVVFALGAALGGAFAAHADDGTALGASSISTGTDETTSSSSTETDVVTTVETDTSSTESDPTTSEAETSPPPPPPTDTTPADGSPGPDAHGGGSSSSHHPHSDNGDAPVVSHTKHSPRAPETKEGGVATIWLHRELPDPTPPAKRLTPVFAALLRSTAQAEGIHWWPILAVLRAHGHDGPAPAGALKLRRLAHRLADHSRRLDAQERSLAHYNRAVGLRALVVGLERAKPSLERRILRDPRIGLTAAGAGDLVAGRVDVRVLVVIRYLVVRFHQVSVSSLVTGHRFFARPHVVSAHVDGLAVDISSLKGLPITGNQGIGGVAEHAIKALLRLPVEVQPQQIISLLGLGGASFPQADHYDHIHVGF
jgi:hypothetical protein